jgi:hypothetical protein
MNKLFNFLFNQKRKQLYLFTLFITLSASTLIQTVRLINSNSRIDSLNVDSANWEKQNEKQRALRERMNTSYSYMKNQIANCDSIVKTLNKSYRDSIVWLKDSMVFYETKIIKLIHLIKNANWVSRGNVKEGPSTTLNINGGIVVNESTLFYFENNSPKYSVSVVGPNNNPIELAPSGHLFIRAFALGDLQHLRKVLLKTQGGSAPFYSAVF